MNRRPELNLPKTKFAKAAEKSSFLLAGYMLIGSILAWDALPDQIPVHFTVFGDSGHVGGKAGIFIFPIIGFFSALFFSFASKGASMLNYPIKITEENAEQVYRETRRMLHILQLLIAVMLTLLHTDVVLNAYEKTGLGSWMMPAFLILLVGTIGFFMYRLAKIK